MIALIPLVLAHWKTGLFALVAIALGAAILLVRHEHAEVAALQTRVAAAELQVSVTKADAQANEIALEREAAKATARAARATTLRSTVHAAPSSSSCAASAPVRALLDGLRADGGGGPAPAGAAVAPAVRR